MSTPSAQPPPETVAPTLGKPSAAAAGLAAVVVTSSAATRNPATSTALPAGIELGGVSSKLNPSGNW
jgi:hypothetical protein